MDKFAEFGNRWSGWAKIIATVVALLALLGLGSFIYNDIWQKKSLTYTILPSYDLGKQAFSGLVIENRGRVPLTDVQIIVTDLEAPIQALQMPGVHEPANIIDGGEGQNQVRIELPRLSKEGSLSIYLMTGSVVSIAPGDNFLVTSAETVAKSSTELDIPSTVVGSVLIFVTVLVSQYFIFVVLLNKEVLKQRQNESTHHESSNAPPSP